MGFLNNLLHGPAVLAMKNAEPETPTIMDSMPEAISWPTDAEFAGYANGMYCREYAVRVVVDFITRTATRKRCATAHWPSSSAIRAICRA